MQFLAMLNTRAHESCSTDEFSETYGKVVDFAQSPVVEFQ